MQKARKGAAGAGGGPSSTAWETQRIPEPLVLPGVGVHPEGAGRVAALIPSQGFPLIGAATFAQGTRDRREGAALIVLCLPLPSANRISATSRAPPEQGSL